jgi:enterobacterial common antigen flippase
MSAPAELAPDPGLRRALGFSTGGTAAARATGALGGVLVARLLGPAGRGELAVLVVTATAIAMAATCGLQFWAAREVARSGATRRVGAVLARHALVVIVLVPVACLAVTPLLALLASADAAAIAATALVAMTAAVNLMVLAIPNGARAMGVVAAATASGGALYVVGACILLATGRASVTLVLVTATIANLVSAGIALAYARRTAAQHARVEPSGGEYREALAFGIPGGLAELVLLAMLRVDVLLVAAFLPLREVGLYVVAVALTELLWIIPDGVAQVVLPTTARAPGYARTRQLLRVALGITAVAGVVVSLVARPVIDAVFGAAFGDAAVAVPLLAVASLAGGSWKILGADVVARGRTTPRLTSAIAGLVVMVVVDLVAVPTLGIAGAALGAAAGYAAAAACIARSWSTERSVARQGPMVAGDSI